jgi:ACT domain-containing protein
MNIGDNIYHIKTISNAFSKQKIMMVDAEGIEWYRYDKHNWTFELETHIIIGKISVSIEGTIDENDMVENSYYTDKSMTLYQSDIDSTKFSPYWFSNEDTAQKKLIELRERYAY